LGDNDNVIILAVVTCNSIIDYRLRTGDPCVHTRKISLVQYICELGKVCLNQIL